ncbi:hypothetical protein ACSFCD_12925, partial [Enterococcus faecalis]
KIDIKKFKIYDDEKFVLDFLHKHHILLVHGGGFNWTQPDHFRIVYLPKLDDLKTMTTKMEEFLTTYRQAAAKIQADSDVLVVIGIGGSYLGARS